MEIGSKDNLLMVMAIRSEQLITTQIICLKDVR